MANADIYLQFEAFCFRLSACCDKWGVSYSLLWEQRVWVGQKSGSVRSDPKGFNRGSELPVILAFSPKIQVDAHLDNRTHISTDRIYVAYLVGPHKHNRKHTFTIQSNAQANGKMKKKYIYF